MLPVHSVPQTEGFYSNRIQQPLYVSEPESADHAKWTGETFSSSAEENSLLSPDATAFLTKRTVLLWVIISKAQLNNHCQESTG